MTPEQWQQIEQVFHAAVERAPRERPGFIRQACRGDSWLQEQVLLLVSRHEETGSLLNQPVPGVRELLALGEEGKPALSPGDRLSPRFRTVRLIGRGGMGEVYEVEDLELGEKVAAKLLHQTFLADDRSVSRFKREVQLSRRITHPNVCRVYDLSLGRLPGSGGECFFLTMELLDGKTLRDFLIRRSRLSLDEARPLVRQMAEALQAAHRCGVVHRDLKPSNVILVPGAETAGHRVVITDFGLARMLSPSPASHPTVSGSGKIMGTPLYMAPEQLEGKEMTPAADIYALGLILYEMVTGSSPFHEGNLLVAAFARLWVPPPSPQEAVPDLDDRWARLILQCLARDPSQRPQLTEIADLTQSRGPSKGKPLALTDSPPPSRLKDRRLWLSGTLALLFLALFAAAIRFYPSKAQPRELKGLVAEVTNMTSPRDDDLDSLHLPLARQLGQSERIEVMDTNAIAYTWGRMKETPVLPVPAERSLELAFRSNASFVVGGTVSRNGGSGFLLELELRFTDGGSNSADWKDTFSALSKDELFAALGQGAASISRFLGETTHDSRSGNRLLENVTTSSWEALNHFVRAEQEKLAGETDLAIDSLKRAVEADPDFTLAYARLGDLLSQQGSPERLVYWKKTIETMQLGRLTSRELYRIRGLYAFDTGDFPKSLRIFKEWAEADPENDLPRFYQSHQLVVSGRIEEALKRLEEALELKPDGYYTIAQLARCHLVLRQYPEAEGYLRLLREQARELGEGAGGERFSVANALEGSLHFLRGDLEQAQSLFRQLRKSSRPFWQGLSYTLESSLLAEQGRYKDARQVLEDGIADDQQKSRATSIANRRMAMAYLEFKRGRVGAARQLCQEVGDSSLAGSQLHPENLMRAGSLLAQMGFPGVAESYLENLDPNSPDVVFKVARKRVEGEIALAEGKLIRARESLEEALRLDPGAYQAEALSRALEKEQQIRRALDVIDPYIDRPGRQWTDTQLYPPGLWADLLFRGARLETERGPLGSNGSSRPKERLNTYLALRQVGDDSLLDLEDARRLRRRLSQNPSTSEK